jgi:2-keto-3-deoxy-L-fuconate dehydrogenase
VVTGAGSGIGAATAGRLNADGFAIVAADIQGEAAARTTEGLAGPSVSATVDVRDEGMVRDLIALAERTGRLEVLVNVAGVGSTTAVTDTSVETWEAVLGVNARGTFLCCKHALAAMLPRRRGSIVNVASVAGLVGLKRRAAYCASKGAVIALTRAIAVDHVAEGIRCNCVCPGTVDSPWVRRLVDEAGEDLEALRSRQPIGRLGMPDEIAAAISYLASDAAGFVTGSALVIDGGLTAA